MNDGELEVFPQNNSSRECNEQLVIILPYTFFPCSRMLKHNIPLVIVLAKRDH